MEVPTTEQISRRKRTRSDPAPDRQPPRKRTHREAEPKSPEQPSAPRGREWREPWLPKGVRRCQTSPHLFQFRPYVGPCKQVYPVNCGVYPSEYEAGRVAREFWRRLARGMSPWDIIHELIASGDVSASISFRWVYPVPGGWAVKVRARGAAVELSGPYASPRAARLAADLTLKPRRQTAVA